jgi:hypothetical protein
MAHDSKLMRGDKPFLFTAFSCHPSAFANVHEASPRRKGPSWSRRLKRR